MAEKKVCECCNTCRYGLRDEHERVVACRRHAPVVITDGTVAEVRQVYPIQRIGIKQFAADSVYPSTNNIGWCGDWEQ